MEYFNYHKHTHKSNVRTIDCIIKPSDYIARMKELGHTYYSTIEHGWAGNYIEDYGLCKDNDMHMIFGSELYIVEDRLEKDNSNHHIILIAKNREGFLQLNGIMSESNKTGFYYKNRIDFQLINQLDPSLFYCTSACVAGILRDEKVFHFIKDKFKDNFFLEVQSHNHPSQKTHNANVLKLAEKYNIKIVHANDSHYVYPDQAKDRDLFLRGKGFRYDEEEGFVLDYPDYNEVVKRYQAQSILNPNQIQEALDNTMILTQCEDLGFTKDTKMPNPFGNQDTKKMFKNLIKKKWNNESKQIPSKDHRRYMEGIVDEMLVVLNTDMQNYFLINEKIIDKAVNEYGGTLTKSGRGCFTEHALVHTKTDMKRIKDVQIGDEIITKKGNFVRVNRTMRYEVDEPLVQIDCLYNNNTTFPNICTLDHRIYVRTRANTLLWIPAGQVTTTQCVCVPKMKNKNPEINIDLNKFNIFKMKFDKEWIYEDKDRKIKRYLDLDYEFNHFLALLYSKGNLLSENNTLEIILSKDSGQSEFMLDTYIRFMKKIGLQFEKNENVGCITLHTTSKILTEFIRKMLFEHKFEKNTIFNPFWFNQREDSLKGFIEGIKMCRGTIVDGHYRFETPSSSLANAYKIICLYCEGGINSLVYREPPREAYTIKSTSRLSKAYADRAGVEEDENFYYLPIKKRKRLPKRKTYVYDLSVDGNSHETNYLINNMIVHNSCVGFYTNKLLGFTEIDRFKAEVPLYPSRFMSESRILETKSLPDYL
jgi:hypothetical protein